MDDAVVPVVLWQAFSVVSDVSESHTAAIKREILVTFIIIIWLVLFYTAKLPHYFKSPKQFCQKVAHTALRL